MFKKSLWIFALAGLLMAGLIACNPTQGASTTTVSESPATEVLNKVISQTGEDAQPVLDGTIIADLVQRIEDGYWGKVDSLLIQKDGELLVEEYFRGYERDTIHRMYSVTKSITSMLIGIAMDKGHIQSLDQTLLSFFPEYDVGEIQNYDERKAAITLENLLNMRAGFRWDEWSSRYGSPSNSTYPLFGSADWMKYMLDLPMAHTPGAQFTYNSGVTMLLSGIIRNTTGMNVREFAVQHLFGPLGIENFDWEEGPDDIFNTGWGSFLRPLDMVKLGTLMLNGGVWNGEQIISRQWVEMSTNLVIRRSSTNGYGFQWWHTPLFNLADHNPQLGDLTYAGGWGGQQINIIWDLDLIVVVTGENYDGAPRNARSMIFDFVVPALNNEAPVTSP